MNDTTPADLKLRAACLEANLEELALPARTRDAVLAATPRGRIVRLGGDAPVVLDGDRALGAPADDASQAAVDEAVAAARHAVVVVLGVGAGHAVRDLCAHAHVEVVVYEPCAGILRTLLEWGPCDLGCARVVTELADLRELWQSIARGNPAALVVATPGYEAAFPEASRALTEVVEGLVADVKLFEYTRSMRFRTWVSDVIANVETLATTSPVLALDGAFRGVPAFIVGAGPSLAKNVARLRDAAARGLVLAVDVAGRPLAKAGVEPQVVVCLEALNLSRELADLPFIDRVVRAVSLSASPASLRAGGGPLLPFFECLRPFSPVAELVGTTGLAVGGSVSTVAFSLAERLGCSPIVLVGQDLAYTGGRTHAEGTVFEASRAHAAEGGARIAYAWCDEAERVRAGSELGPPQRGEDAFVVPAWGDGEPVVSTITFNAYREWFESAARWMRTARPEVRLVNATEGGSRIAGFEEARLEDVLATLPERGITAAELAQRASERRPPLARAEIDAWARRQAALAHAAARAARSTQRAAKRALGSVGEGPTEVAAAFGGLARAEARLREAAGAQPMLEAWAYRELGQIGDAGRARRAVVDARSDAEWGLATEMEVADVVATAAVDLARALEAIAHHV